MILTPVIYLSRAHTLLPTGTAAIIADLYSMRPSKRIGSDHNGTKRRIFAAPAGESRVAAREEDKVV